MSVREVAATLAAGLVVANCASGSDDTATSTVATATETTVAPDGTSVDVDVDVAAQEDPAQDVDSQSESGFDVFDGVSLAASSTEPFEAVELTGPDQSDVTFALFELADGATWGTPVLQGAAGAFVLVPPVPDAPYEGGSVGLRFTDGEEVGDEVLIDVAPLPDTDTTLDDVVERMRGSIDRDARLLGSSWDELSSAEVGDIDAGLVPLKIAQTLVDDGTSNSVAGELADLDPEIADLVADMLAATGFAEPLGEDVLAERIADAETEELGQTEPVGFASVRRSMIASSAGMAGRAAARLRQSGDCIPFNPEPEISAERLSEMMTSSALGEIASDSSTLANKYLNAAELAMGLAAALEKATPSKGVVTGTFAKLIVGEKMRQAMNAGLLPSAFTDLDVTLSPGTLEEDREEPGSWSEVMVTAVSTGYHLDADLAGIAIDALGDRVVGGAGIAEGSLLEHEAGAAVGEVKGAVTSAIPNEDGFIEICPNTWRVDITGEDYSWARPQQALLTVGNANQTYKNEKELGVETLRFAPLEESFGGRTILGDIDVETVMIEVMGNPNTVKVTAPKEVASITAEIDNAVVETLAWVPEEGKWADGRMDDTNGPGTRPLETPNDPKLFPFDVVIKSTSRQGLRRNASDERTATVTVELDACIVGAWFLNPSSNAFPGIPSGGSWSLTIAPDGAFVSTQSNLSYTVPAGAGGTGTLSFNGTQTGTLDFTATEIQASGAVSAAPQLNGENLPGNPTPLAGGAVRYECDDDQLTILDAGAQIVFDSTL